ncbi:hypothetical protein F5882DRAFT_418704 [Hyaloscypha sp. PMI_1271]|nr:hypothetical protein F5882DRAFT_418704 [Hyaloscypha sp. PMI_1271]
MEATDDALAEVSWQTAFFLLFSIALMAIAQPCGQFLGAHSKHRVWLRTSPFLCLIDTILMFIQYQYYSAKGDGPRDALRRIARLRFAGTAPAIARAPADQIELRAQTPPEGDTTDGTAPDVEALDQEEIVPSQPYTFPQDGETLAEMQQNLVLRFILVVFPLYPAIKLFTLVGIPWTKTFAGMYIASILSVEVMLWCAKPYDQVPRLSAYSDDIFISNPLATSSYIGSNLQRRIVFGSTAIMMVTVVLQGFYPDNFILTIFIFIYFFITYSPISLSTRVGTSSTILSCFRRSILVVHSYLLYLYVPDLSNGTSLDQWLIMFYDALSTAAVQSLVFSGPGVKFWDLLLFPIICLCSFLLLAPSEIFTWRHSFFTSGILEYYSYFIYLFGIVCLLTLLPLPFYRKYEYHLFAAHNLVAFLLCYAYTYDPSSTASPSWEFIWG